MNEDARHSRVFLKKKRNVEENVAPAPVNYTHYSSVVWKRT
jgi:hypothetical protein